MLYLSTGATGARFGKHVEGSGRPLGELKGCTKDSKLKARGDWLPKGA